MAQPLDGKRRPKRVAMVLALGVLGAVLALLLTLLYLLYWLRAPAPLPDPALLMLPGQDAFLVVRPDEGRKEDRETLRRMLGVLLAESPDIVRRAARYGLAEERAGTCPMLLTLSWKASGTTAYQWTGTVSLGRYRGAFWMAERALRRQSREGTIPYARRSVSGGDLYEATRSQRSGPGALGIWRATGIAGSGLDAVAHVRETLETSVSPADAAPPDAEGPFGRGRVLRPDPVFAALLRELIGESADPGPLSGALESIEFDLHAGPEGTLAFEAVAPWRENANRDGVVRAAGELLRLPRDSGNLLEFNVHPGEQALEVYALFHFPERSP